MESVLLHPTAILHDKYTNDIGTITVVIGQIQEAKKCSVILAKLKAKLPLPSSLKHLKRIRTKQVTNDHKVIDVMIDTGDNVDKCCTLLAELDLESDILNCRVVSVPAEEPLTRAQYEKCQLLWPSTFLEDKVIMKLLKGTYFSHDDLQFISRMFLYVTNFAEEYNMVPVAAIVDPVKSEILASAQDCTDLGNPMYHSCFVAVDMIAKRQNGGALHIPYRQSDNGSYVVCRSAFEEGGLKRSFERKYTAKAMDDSAVVIDMTSKNIELPCCSTDIHKKRKKENAERDVSSKTTPYLCTGYDLYTTHEPCVFCAMALLHSRIRRVFFIKADTNFGGLGGRYKIHVHPELNHHFQVFRK